MHNTIVSINNSKVLCAHTLTTFFCKDNTIESYHMLSDICLCEFDLCEGKGKNKRFAWLIMSNGKEGSFNKHACQKKCILVVV